MEVVSLQFSTHLFQGKLMTRLNQIRLAPLAPLTQLAQLAHHQSQNPRNFEEGDSSILLECLRRFFTLPIHLLGFNLDLLN